ncbi:hypothetical protein A2U01_0105669, partial [Trifolium medium]|nr:hypothetical protein [Trifolium medium]
MVVVDVVLQVHLRHTRDRHLDIDPHHNHPEHQAPEP